MTVFFSKMVVDLVRSLFHFFLLSLSLVFLFCILLLYFSFLFYQFTSIVEVKYWVSGSVTNKVSIYKVVVTSHRVEDIEIWIIKEEIKRC